MNIFKGLLFLQGYLTDPSLADDDDFSPTYGNRRASERSFGPIAAHPVADAVPGEGCGFPGSG